MRASGPLQCLVRRHLARRRRLPTSCLASAVPQYGQNDIFRPLLPPSETRMTHCSVFGHHSKRMSNTQAAVLASNLSQHGWKPRGILARALQAWCPVIVKSLFMTSNAHAGACCWASLTPLHPAPRYARALKNNHNLFKRMLRRAGKQEWCVRDVIEGADTPLSQPRHLRISLVPRTPSSLPMVTLIKGDCASDSGFRELPADAL